MAKEDFPVLVREITKLKTALNKISGNTVKFSQVPPSTVSPQSEASYADKSLQVVWNIVDTFEQATDKGWFSRNTFLLGQKSTMTDWFISLEKGPGNLATVGAGTGTPHIINEKTQKLATAFLEFLTVIVVDDGAYSLLTSFGIEPLKVIKDLLTTRLTAYAKAQDAAAKAAAEPKPDVPATPQPLQAEDPKPAETPSAEKTSIEDPKIQSLKTELEKATQERASALDEYTKAKAAKDSLSLPKEASKVFIDKDVSRKTKLAKIHKALIAYIALIDNKEAKRETKPNLANLMTVLEYSEQSEHSKTLKDIYTYAEKQWVEFDKHRTRVELGEKFNKFVKKKPKATDNAGAKLSNLLQEKSQQVAKELAFELKAAPTTSPTYVKDLPDDNRYVLQSQYQHALQQETSFQAQEALVQKTSASYLLADLAKDKLEVDLSLTSLAKSLDFAEQNKQLNLFFAKPELQEQLKTLASQFEAYKQKLGDKENELQQRYTSFLNKLKECELLNQKLLEAKTLSDEQAKLKAPVGGQSFFAKPEISALKPLTLSEVRDKFWGSDPMHLGGESQLYLDNRAHHYWLSDFFSFLASLVFGLFNYETDSSRRNKYLNKLHATFTDYETDKSPEHLSTFDADIDQGLNDFKARKDYAHSMHAMLSELKGAVHATLPTPQPELSLGG